MTLIDRILAATGPVPNEQRYRHWLEGQKTAALEARLKQLERENTEPQQRPWHTWQKIAAATAAALADEP